MKECLSAKKAEDKSAKTTQQEKMKACNADAKTKALSGRRAQEVHEQLPEQLTTGEQRRECRPLRGRHSPLVGFREESADDFELDPAVAFVLARVSEGDAATTAQDGSSAEAPFRSRRGIYVSTVGTFVDQDILVASPFDPSVLRDARESWVTISALTSRPSVAIGRSGPRTILSSP